MNDVDHELALTETLNALSVLVECLGSPLGHPPELATARGHVLAAMSAMGAVGEEDEAAVERTIDEGGPCDPSDEA